MEENYMKRRIVLGAAAAVLFAMILTACSGSPRFTQITADGSGTITIPTEGITNQACFFNYDADGLTVQLVALRDTAGGVHIAFNTCQSCTPSPKAYYTQEGDLLKCENCGFTFSAEEVGIVHGGCNPWPIEGVEAAGDSIRIPAASLDAMRPAFARWGGPVK